MPKQSAGLLLYRGAPAGLQVLLVHPGGPFWARKDQGAWSIPKGELNPDEDPLQAAIRETAEELGCTVTGPFVALQPIRQAAGKLVHCWAAQSDFDPAQLESNTFSLEWPPKSGRTQHFPEVDRAAWFTLNEARTRIHAGQLPLIDQLAGSLA